MCNLANDQSILAVDDQGSPVLVALGMTERGTCDASFVTRFMRVAPYVDWMRGLDAQFDTADGVQAYGGIDGLQPLDPEPSPPDDGEGSGKIVAGGDIDGFRSVAVAIGVPVALVAAAVLLVAALGVISARRR